jgi:hypothetical protein
MVNHRRQYFAPFGHRREIVFASHEKNINRTNLNCKEKKVAPGGWGGAHFTSAGVVFCRNIIQSFIARQAGLFLVPPGIRVKLRNDGFKFGED